MANNIDKNTAEILCRKRTINALTHWMANKYNQLNATEREIHNCMQKNLT